MDGYKRGSEVRGRSFDPTPFIPAKLPKGVGFTGELVEKAEGLKKVGQFQKYVYQIKLIDVIGELPVLITLKKGEQPTEAEVGPGSIVTLFAGKPLHDKLTAIPLNGVFEGTYNGKMPSKNGYFHDWSIFPLEKVS